MNSPYDDRGSGRPVKRRTRTFRPNYLAFAPCYQCNLTCPHCCVPIEWTDRLDIDVAIRFLEERPRATASESSASPAASRSSIRSSSSPSTRRAAELGFRFDKIVTNGVWYRDQRPSANRCSASCATPASPASSASASTSSTASTPTRLADFCRTARADLRARQHPVAVLRQPRPDQGLEPVRALAADARCRRRLVGHAGPLSARVARIDDDAELEPPGPGRAGREARRRLGRRLVRGGLLRGARPGADRQPARRGQAVLRLRLATSTSSPSATSTSDSVAEIVRRAREHPYVGKVFREGLTRDPRRDPGPRSRPRCRGRRRITATSAGTCSPKALLTRHATIPTTASAAADSGRS